MIPYYIFEHTIYLFDVIPIRLWGLMVALGFLAGFFVAQKEAARKGLNVEVFHDLFVYIFLGGLVGARIWYVLFYWPEDTPRTLYEMIAFWNGGMAFFGGFLAALAAGYLFTRLRQLSFLQYADAVMPGLVIGHAIGRIGCYLTGLHLGIQTTVPWALYVMNGDMAGELRHPVVLYEIIYLVAIFIILIKLRSRLTHPGTMVAAYSVLYGTARFANDFFRDAAMDPHYIGLTATQYGLMAIALSGLVYLLKWIKR